MINWITGALLSIAAVSAPLDNSEDEARAQKLMREIRCVACENEPVSQSAAPIAEDMRARIRSLVDSGATDQEVRDWFEARYGAHALFRPSSEGAGGLLIWLGPFVLLASGIGIAIAVRNWSGEAEAVPVAPESLDQAPDTET
ncbi:MAG: cytochrome c-type biogenesis protein [Pseudomonadota bacterium]